MLNGLPYSDELNTAIEAVTAAGRAVIAFYDRDDAAIYTKPDGSPVTDADLAADNIIRAILTERFPDDAILTEEGADDPGRFTAQRCWVVDPIDGTDQFVRRTGEFDVFVALVADGRPIVAASRQPPTGRICAATAGGGAWHRENDSAPWERFTFPPLTNGQSPQLAASVWFGAPANALLLERVAAQLGTPPPLLSTVGFGPRFFLPPHPRHALIGAFPDPASEQAMGWEWDFAVGDLFLHEAGGVVSSLYGNLHRYNKPHLRNRGGLIAASDPTLHRRLLAALAAELPCCR